jgi:EAL domain-containing protein (putative c-di-GMP-specific phosphodiesterase class I)
VSIAIQPYHELVLPLTAQLRDVGHLALVLVDVSELARVEHDYGSRAFARVFAAASELVADLQGEEYRTADRLAVDDRGGNGFLIFLAPQRGAQEARPRIADLQAIATRIADHLERRLATISSPYLRRRIRLPVGYGVVFQNPLVAPERVVARLVDEAWDCVRIQKLETDFQSRSRLQDLLLGGQLATVFQPVVDLQLGGVHGFEALSRGPAGGPYEDPGRLFEDAAAADLVFEADRHCRRAALAAARDLPPPHRLFLNVVPASMYDPDFQGPEVVQMVSGFGLAPERIVLEVSEQYAIESYRVFVEALRSFTQLGFLIAVDDIGAGYSGLEKIAQLNPRYLKFDMRLVREIESSQVKREMARALKTFADTMGSKIIAEGIETERERRACVELGIHYGQGFLLGRPAPLDGFSLGAAAASSAP